MRRKRFNKQGELREQEIRGLRVCNNGNCRAHTLLNRDLNASLNIAKRGYLLAHRRDYPNSAAVASKLDEAHMQLRCQLCQDGMDGG